MSEPPQENEPCKELLKRFEMEHLEAAEHDLGEIVTVMVIAALYVFCILLSVSVDLATAIESIPVLGMASFHKREAVKTVARKIPLSVKTRKR